MPHEPKRRHSRERKGERRASITLTPKQPVICANCGNFTQPHAVCMYCGFYKGREVIQRTKTAK